MVSIVIDEEFRSLLPTLDQRTYGALEENIIQNGCRDAIVLWNGTILIDGHNRYEICVKHDIPFRTVNREFSSREEVLIWIVSNQVARRNLTPVQLSHYRGVHYLADKKLVKNSVGRNQHNVAGEVFHQNDGKPKIRSTAVRLAGQYKVSSATIERDAKVATAIGAIGEASPTAKQKILGGEVNIDKRVLAELSLWEKEDIIELAASIENGTYEKGKYVHHAPVCDCDSAEPLLGSGDSLGRFFTGLMDNVLSMFRKCSGNGNASVLKSALRSFINSLEALYNSL